MTLISINKYDLPTYLESLKEKNKEDTNEERLYYLELRASIRRKTRNGYLRQLEELTLINNGYTTLSWALLSFKPDRDQNAVTGSLEEQTELLRKIIVTEYLQVEKLKEEYDRAMNSGVFKWVEFLKANEIISSSDKINEDEAKEWVISLLAEFI